MRFDVGTEVFRSWIHWLFRPKRSRQHRVALDWAPMAGEVLEERCLLSSVAPPAATYAGPSWTDPKNLTVSFAPDGTQVGGQSSSLFATMDSITGTDLWKSMILDAFQTWAANANINFSRVADGGQPFGAPGKTQGDPQFGDIRISAAPLSSNVLAMAIPAAGSAAGTWTGDIIFNANVDFSNLNDLYEVALHEAGHSLGLPDSLDPNSPMFIDLIPGSVRQPTPADIAALQQIYGPRIPNPIVNPVNNGGIPIVQAGSQRSSLDEGLTDHPNDWATSHVTYALINMPSEVESVDPASPVSSADPIASVPQTSGIGGQTGETSGGDSQEGLPNQPSSIELASTPGLVDGTQFDTAGVLTSEVPVVTYQVASAQIVPGQTNVMTVTVQSDPAGGIVPSVSVLDAGGNMLAGQILTNGSGQYVLQVTGTTPGMTYFVSIGSTTSLPAGNLTAAYSMDISFSQMAAPLDPFVSGTLGPAQTRQFFQFNVAQSALFQLALHANTDDAANNVAVQMAVFDQSGNQVCQLVGTTGGILTGNPVLLQQGNYLVRVSAASSHGSLAANLSFALLGNILSDAIGPLPVDPTATPPSPGTPLTPPFNWKNVVIVPPHIVVLSTFKWVPIMPLAGATAIGPH